MKEYGLFNSLSGKVPSINFRLKSFTGRYPIFPSSEESLLSGERSVLHRLRRIRGNKSGSLKLTSK
jgi:hypothetical protein